VHRVSHHGPLDDAHDRARKTGYALAGAHQQVACAKCHATGVKTALRFDTCTACHVNVHRDSVKDDCRKCHTEASFKGAKFDRAAHAKFPCPAGTNRSRAGSATRASQRGRAARAQVIDFGGASPSCATCHKDQHKGDYGRTCDACHRADTFKAAGFTHPRLPDFYAGRHAGVACVKCHTRPADIPAARAGLPRCRRAPRILP